MCAMQEAEAQLSRGMSTVKSAEPPFLIWAAALEKTISVALGKARVEHTTVHFGRVPAPSELRPIDALPRVSSTPPTGLDPTSDDPFALHTPETILASKCVLDPFVLTSSSCVQ